MRLIKRSDNKSAALGLLGFRHEHDSLLYETGRFSKAAGFF
ncbi:hypothetical protein X474_10665 [Dethiosulfatarculus sandiegensis]|uniref:Uncharacterized protein n=1 Tax=Dethiosulfatarculus sandiegensis TaxID=1429043 RepID=A0A0D2HUH0_9BACT|nr:hypothetical protein X474_10665 [Dethiosulfatarculus sandiegensis]